jgi:plasmid stabilization system protein ParE
MSKYKIVYLPSAQHDIDEAVRYLAENLQNPTAANCLLDTIDEKAGKLRGGSWKGFSLKNHASGLFEDIDMNWISVKNYYLFFRIDEDDKTIRCHHFSHRLRGLHYVLKEADE